MSDDVKFKEWIDGETAREDLHRIRVWVTFMGVIVLIGVCLIVLSGVIGMVGCLMQVYKDNAY